MMNIKTLSTFALSGILFFSACVPARQFEEVKAKFDKCETERNALSAANKKLETDFKELTAEHEKRLKNLRVLEKDTTNLGKTYRKLLLQYDKINDLNDQLINKHKEMREGSEKESEKLLSEIERMQLDLQRKEDDLKDAERELENKKGNLDQLSTKLDGISAELEKREARVKELEALIKQKDEAVTALKNKIAEALLGFKDKGLTIEQRNGKIYVSLEAKLLFAKGSTKVDQEGKQALIDLAKILESQSDISVVVEGHTDTDKMSGSGCLKDNWDLSVMRATSVVKIMTDNSQLDPKQLTAAGRGEFIPVDDQDVEEAKAKNRRIEVVLSPNLDEVFKILEEPKPEE